MARLDEDVKWKMESDQYQLSVDGFCNECKEFHTDCFCEGYWIRKAAALKDYNRTLVKRNKDHKDLISRIENCVVCITISPVEDVMQSLLKILFKGDKYEAE